MALAIRMTIDKTKTNKSQEITPVVNDNENEDPQSGEEKVKANCSVVDF